MASEADLALIVSSWLRNDGWTTYHEVPVDQGRCDILAVRGPLVWAVETKMRHSLEVLHQALDRQRSSSVHGVLIAVPSSKTILKMARLCKLLGVGLLAVQAKGNVSILAWPNFVKKAKTKELLSTLSPIQERQQAGTTRTSYWTPFKAAARDFVIALRAAGEMPVNDAAKLPCVTTYKGTKAPAPALRRWILWAVETGAIPGCRCEGKGRQRKIVYDESLLPEKRASELHLKKMES